MADGCIMVTAARVTQGAWRLQVENMVLAVLAGKPKVPDPLVGQAERH